MHEVPRESEEALLGSALPGVASLFAAAPKAPAAAAHAQLQLDENGNLVLDQTSLSVAGAPLSALLGGAASARDAAPVEASSPEGPSAKWTALEHEV